MAGDMITATCHCGQPIECRKGLWDWRHVPGPAFTEYYVCYPWRETRQGVRPCPPETRPGYKASAEAADRADAAYFGRFGQLMELAEDGRPQVRHWEPLRHATEDELRRSFAGKWTDDAGRVVYVDRPWKTLGEHLQPATA